MFVALYIEKGYGFTFLRFCIMEFTRVLEDIHIDVEAFSILILSVGNVSNLELILRHGNANFFIEFANECFVRGFSWLYVTCGKLPFSIFVACIFPLSEKDFSRTISDDSIYRSKEVRSTHSFLVKNKNPRILQEFRMNQKIPLQDRREKKRCVRSKLCDHDGCEDDLKYIYFFSRIKFL